MTIDIVDCVSVTFTYQNRRGEMTRRDVYPRELRSATSPWHQGVQWLLDGFDKGKSAPRTFAVADIREWHVAPGWLQALCGALVEAEQLKADLAKCREVCESLVARCAGQSEILSRRAEKPPTLAEDS